MIKNLEIGGCQKTGLMVHGQSIEWAVPKKMKGMEPVVHKRS
jgi:hypothetical protein